MVSGFPSQSKNRFALVMGGAILILFLAAAHATAGASAPAPPHASRAPAAQAGGSSRIYLPFIAGGFPAPSPLWRFGVAQALRPFNDYSTTDIRAMRFGWYVDWGSGGSPLPAYGMEYIPLVRVKQYKVDPVTHELTNARCKACDYAVPPSYSVSLSQSQIETRAQAHKGMTWVIGNEIDRRDWDTGNQDEIVPELYAQAYHQIWAEIKAADPTAHVAIAGVIEATPLRLAYLTRVWNEYDRLYGNGMTNTMPVDVWNLHEFVLPEKNCAYYPGDCWGAQVPAGMDNASGQTYSVLDNKDFRIAWDHIKAMRGWMAIRGQQHKPLIITEYGVLMSDWVYPGQFTPAQVRDSFMYPSFNAFLNQTDCSIGFREDGCRLVQRWNWYSLDDDSRSVQGEQLLDNFNGYLFYSGLSAQSLGLSTLGTYWKQYVQALPAGSSKPY